MTLQLVNSSQRQLSSSWYCWLGGWLVIVFLKNGSKDFLDFLHEVTHR